MAFQTEYEFQLPRGYIDGNGDIHKKGIMRLATAADEIMPVRDPRVQANPEYLTIMILSRVIIKLGTLEHINTSTIEQFFTADLAYLNDFYQRINTIEEPEYEGICPNCHQHIKMPIAN